MQFINTHQLNNAPTNLNGDCVLYLTSTNLRTLQNASLHNTELLGAKLNKPIVVVFNAYQNFKTRNNHIIEFLYSHLKTLEGQYKKLNIPFYVWMSSRQELLKKINAINPCAVFVDFCPLTTGQSRAKYLAQNLNLPVYETDAKNIIPAWLTSQKAEFSATTIRPKIKKLLADYLVPLPAPKPQGAHAFKFTEFNIAKTLTLIKCPQITDYKLNILPGEKAAHTALNNFLQNHYVHYAQKHNDPNANASSLLSAYLHFGILSPLQITLEVIKKEQELGKITADYNGIYNIKSLNVKMFENSYLEELIVRRELAQNFCYYNCNYANSSCAPLWAATSLHAHTADKRDFIYSQSDFETAKTHDPLWNAAQNQLTKTGYMAGYMRMYWAKKILEWSADAAQAQQIAIYLNDKYQVDGADANGYTGIAWSIYGVHDKPWFDRPIFGKIRYMNANGCKTKFDVNKFIMQNSDSLQF